MDDSTSGSLDPITLSQAEVLAHPLRRRMLATFREGERSLEQVAEALQEPVGELGTHAEMLERASLVRCTRVVATAGGALPLFEAVSREMVVPLGQAPDRVAQFLHSTLKAGSEEALRSLDHERVQSAGDDLYLSVNSVVHADDAALRELTELVVDWVRRQRSSSSGAPPSQVTLASFPIRSDRRD